MENQKSNRWLIIVCFAIIYIVWGSTYLANRYAIDTIPPFLMVTSRLFLAGSILLAIAYTFTKPSKPTRQQLLNAGGSGILFLSLGLAGVVWAEQFIDSGIAAVIVALEPLVVVIVMWGWNKEMPGIKSFIGIALGLFGSWLLSDQDIVISGFMDWMGVLAIFVSLIAWAIGSVFISKSEMPKNQLLTASTQMLVGGLALLPFVFIFGELKGFTISQVTPNSWYGLLFLILFGSIIAFTAFNYLLKQVSPEKVATSTYVHPLVALLLGWSFRGEVITGQTIVAAGIMLLGVFIINAKKSFFQRLFRSKSKGTSLKQAT